MTNEEFVSLMNDDAASRKEPWVKVRWINIGGVSWDVISAVAIKYNLHPLSLEDVLNSRSHNRSKVDYYHKHMFLRVLCHSLASDEDVSPSYDSTLTDLPRSSSPVPFSEKDQAQLEDDEDGTIYNTSATNSRFSTKKLGGIVKRRPTFDADVEKGVPPPSKHRLTQLAEIRDAAREKRAYEKVSIDELKKGQRVNVKVQPIFIFLTRCGTVISIYPAPDLCFTAPISARLRQVDTGLRKSADPSLLVHSLLDLIVDEVMEVVDEYQSQILKLEHEILLKPKMKTVRYLHILSGDLILHKRTLAPIKTIVYGLRRYDVDRCAALIDHTTNPNDKVVGFMSHKAKIYLADVFDHMDYVLTSLDMFAGIAENLINYTFNLSSYEMNEVMRRLTLATIIFLPLTLLTGYFGMNFTFMWSIMNHSDVVFWIIALPLMIIVVPIFTYRDISGMIHYVNKRVAANQAVKTFKQA
jgi:Mg2+ and Co2+ transporter CorA